MGLLDGALWSDNVFSGRWHPGRGGTATAVEPATGAALGTFGVADAQDVADSAVVAVAAQRAWAARNAFERAAVLRRAAELFHEHADEIVEWTARDSGGTRGRGRLEVNVCAEECREAAALATTPYGELLRSPQPRISLERRMPVGLVAVISPFNVPLVLPAARTARVKAVMDQRAGEAAYGITGDDLTPSVSWSLYSLRKDWNIAKNEVAPWWRECSKEAFSTGLDQLARALKNWADSRNGRRKGKPAGFPRFRSRRKDRPPVRFTTGAFRCEARHAVLPRIGRVKLHESGTRLAALVAAGTARVLAATVRFERGRWLASFTADAQITRPSPARPGAVVGVDLGIKTLAVLSTGEEIPNPRHLSRALRGIRRLARTASRRQGPDRRTGQEPSNRWRRASAALGKAQGRVADQRKDSLHKLTTRLAAGFGTVVVEDLNIAGMMKNRQLARHIADASFGEFRRQLSYKTQWAGGTLIVADR